MKTFDEEPAPARGDTIRVGVSERATAADGETLVAYGVGSSVVAALHDPTAGVGGMATVVLPSSDEGEGEATGRYADTAVPALLRETAARGAGLAALEAYVVGGSRMIEFEELRTGVGRENAAAVRETLADLGVPVAAEDVGGEHGRAVELDTATGDVVVHAAHRESVRL